MRGMMAMTSDDEIRVGPRVQDSPALAAGVVARSEDMVDLVGRCRRDMIAAGLPIHHVFSVASALVELGTVLLPAVGAYRVEVVETGPTTLELRIFESAALNGPALELVGDEVDSSAASGGPGDQFGLVVGALARSMRSVQLMHGRTDGMRLRTTLRLDDAGVV